VGGGVFEAISHPTRRRLLLLLSRGERSAGDLASHFDDSRPAVSRHLRVLREAGLVGARGDAQRRVYRLEAALLIEVDEWLVAFRRFWRSRRPPV
jgi:DNA-binding transcriptional ArsR family regulator